MIARFLHWLATPLRASLGLSPAQVRSLYSVAMLAGIVALSGFGVLTVWKAEDAALHNHEWFRLLVEVTRYIFLLIGGFALGVLLIVFGADWFKAKYGDKEIGFGKGHDDEPA